MDNNAKQYFFSNMDNLKRKISSFEEPLKKKFLKHEEILRDMEVTDNELKRDMEELRENKAEILQMMGEQRIIMVNTLSLIEEELNKLNKSEVLSNYRVWICNFIDVVKMKLGLNKWIEVKNAINRKIRGGKADFEQGEKECILQLENLLDNVGMTINDIELLMLLKTKSDAEFQRCKTQTIEEARTQLETSFPDDLKDFKETLQKVFNAFGIWDREA